MQTREAGRAEPRRSVRPNPRRRGMTLIEILIALIVMAVNLIVDVFYAVINPRIRVS
jgi:prepilin-type N-terminal cleavage/methylation domain-containing protein